MENKDANLSSVLEASDGGLVLDDPMELELDAPGLVALVDTSAATFGSVDAAVAGTTLTMDKKRKSPLSPKGNVPKLGAVVQSGGEGVRKLIGSGAP